MINPDITIDWPAVNNVNIYSSMMLEHALLSLIHNAAEAAKSKVVVNIETNNTAIINILHDGENISHDLLNALGKTTISSNKKDGLGVGYYLANASIEQLGGTVDIRNTNEGVLTKVYLPEELLKHG